MKQMSLCNREQQGGSPSVSAKILFTYRSQSFTGFLSWVRSSEQLFPNLQFMCISFSTVSNIVKTQGNCREAEHSLLLLPQIQLYRLKLKHHQIL